jgi:hypothetical protein
MRETGILVQAAEPTLRCLALGPGQPPPIYHAAATRISERVLRYAVDVAANEDVRVVAMPILESGVRAPVEVSTHETYERLKLLVSRN